MEGVNSYVLNAWRHVLEIISLALDHITRIMVLGIAPKY